MPKDPHHRAWELALLPLVLLGAYRLGLRTELLPLAGAYLAGSLFLSPDLDLYHSRPARRWGILRVLWWPYARLFRHRGLSHHLVLGPLTRLLYLGGILVLLGVGLRYLGVQVPRFPGNWVGPVLLGLWLPQLFHILLDLLSRKVARARSWRYNVAKRGD